MNRCYLLSLLLSAQPLYAEVLMEVITTSAYPVHGQALLPRDVRVKVYDLDAPSRWLEALNRSLPADPAVAAALARQRLEQREGERASRELLAAHTALARALAYGLDRYPAIVFDQGTAVVYGVTDLTEALDDYRRWSGSAP